MIKKIKIIGVAFAGMIMCSFVGRDYKSDIVEMSIMSAYKLGYYQGASAAVGSIFRPDLFDASFKKDSTQYNIYFCKEFVEQIGLMYESYGENIPKVDL
jgi:hypothetical protein